MLKANAVFVSYSRLISLLKYAYFMGFLSLGATFIIVTGGIDFSIGPVMFCGTLIAGHLLTSKGRPLPVCLIIAPLQEGIMAMGFTINYQYIQIGGIYLC